MAGFVLRGILIGLLFGVPAGAVGAMTAQRTLNSGMKAGLLTGLGSSAADCLYACVGAFGLTLISDFLLRYQSIINLAGGCLILGMGIRMLQMKHKNIQNASAPVGSVRMFISSFAVGITNPAAILTFLFAFSWFGINGQTGVIEGIGLVCGVFAGTFLWWLVLSGAVSSLKKKAKSYHVRVMNRVFGIILILFGAVVLLTACGSEADRKNENSTEDLVESPTANTESGGAQMQELIIEVNGQSFKAGLYNNETAKALLERLPMTLNMDELNGNEKFYYLDDRLPTDSENVGSIQTGDIMLFGSDCLVLFFEDFSTSYSYTRIGHIEDSQGFAGALADGTVEVTFRAGE